ncbi:MAG: hypothetical protein C3F18_10535 [Nitrosomonadales bacterium]|nr:MAG: hypothetical protein C3F18_10535 [Nitrosomonadales bacterium]
MKKLLGALLLTVWAPLAFAITPYISGDKVTAGDVNAVMGQVEKKLTAEGFTVVGRYSPKGVSQYGVVVVTDKGMLDAIRGVGGATIVGAGVRVGVKADGSVSYQNPDYWYRAYFRKQFSTAEPAVKALQAKLQKTLGAGKGFGGDEPAGDLPNYKYMIGMEKFESDKNELKSHGSFEAAVKTIQDNLAKGTNKTSKVYEIVMADKKIAVFGVAMNDPRTGEGVWLNKIGADHIAAMPYEIYVVGGKASALYGRYRIALGWPNLGMGTFMKISDSPDEILETLTGVAGGTFEKSSAF